MALPSWPAGFPVRPDASGANIGPLYQEPIRTDMEDGPGRARRRSTTTWSEVAFKYALTHAQWPAFQAFVRDTLNHGSSAFTMPVWKPGTTGTPTDRVVKLSGEIQHEVTLPWVFVTLPLKVRDY